MQEEASAFAAFVGIDWADRKHDVCLQVAGSEHARGLRPRASPDGHRGVGPQAARALRRPPVAVCLELSQGPIVSALLEHDIFVIFPVNPSTLAKYRKRLHAQRRQGRPDRRRARPGAPASPPREACARCAARAPNMRALQTPRRGSPRPRARSRAHHQPADVHPQVLLPAGARVVSRQGDRRLRRIPRTLAHRCSTAQRARRETIVDFFHAHNVRYEPPSSTGASRPSGPSEPLTIGSRRHRASARCSSRLSCRNSAPSPLASTASIARSRSAASSFPITSSSPICPGAGPVFAPRLLAAFGEQRERFADAAASRSTPASPQSPSAAATRHWVHWRWACPTFLRQTFVEWVGQIHPALLLGPRLLRTPQGQGRVATTPPSALSPSSGSASSSAAGSTSTPYNESRYLAALQKRHSPLLKFAAQPS